MHCKPVHQTVERRHTQWREGNIPWRENLESTILMLNAWETARLAAEKTGKDAIVYVIGKRIVCRTRTRIDNAA